MYSFYALCTIAAVLWFVSIVAGAVACGLAIRPSPRTFWPALIASIVAVTVSYSGMTRFHVTYSRTVNASHWGVDSKWFFLASLILGGLALALTLWRRVRRVG